MATKRKEQNKNPEFHGDMSHVPTSRRSDGFRHMRTSPEQFPLANWEHSSYFDGKSFEEIVELRKRHRSKEREEITWHDNLSRNVVLGVSASKSFRIHRKYVTEESIGRLFFVWHEREGGFLPHHEGFLSLYAAMQYCEDHLTKVKKSEVQVLVVEDRLTGIASLKAQAAAMFKKD